MLNAIYDFLFTPIMSKVFMGLFYGVKPIILIAPTFVIVSVLVIISVLTIKYNKSKKYNVEINDVFINTNKKLSYNELNELNINNRINRPETEPNTVTDPLYMCVPGNIYYKD